MKTRIAVLAASLALGAFFLVRLVRHPEWIAGGRGVARSAAATQPPAPDKNATPSPAVANFPSAAEPRIGNMDHEPGRRALPQGEAELAAGQAYNLVVKRDAMRLAADARPATGSAEIAGVFVSPIRQIRTPEQQEQEAFDRIDFDYEFTAASGSSVTFEYRTVAVDEEGEGWSPWREIAPEARRHPIALGAMMEKWQYRVVLLARDAAASPEIHAIKVVTHQDPAQAVEIFRANHISRPLATTQ